MRLPDSRDWIGEQPRHSVREHGPEFIPLGSLWLLLTNMWPGRELR